MRCISSILIHITELDFKHFGTKGLTCRSQSLFRFVSFADASQSDVKEERREGNEKTDACVALNLFPRVLRDAAIKREWAERIYAYRDYPITGIGQIVDGISVAPLPYMEDRSNLSPSTYLTTIAPCSRGAVP